jgi:hypothetical protein
MSKDSLVERQAEMRERQGIARGQRERTKWCPKCEKWLPLGDFWNHKFTKSGKRTYCKLCEQDKKFEWGSGGNGWNAEEYAAAEKEQDGKCAICLQLDPRRRLDGDHNHKTGKRRGLLCNAHNLMLGLVDDDPAILEAAAAYLRKYE